MHIRTSLLLVTVLAAPLMAQGVNCALLGTFSNHGPTFNDVWGYTAPNGDEYALLCSNTGAVVVDVSNPATPIERGYFPFGSSIWRDIRTFGTYAYVVTEATAGFQIIDLSNPNSPVLVGTFGTSVSSHAHNVCIDVANGKLYLVGTNVGVPAWDLAANPTNPPYLGQAATTGFHDLHVENGYAYASHISGGVLRIMDTSTAMPWTILSNTPTPNNFTHNAWPNATGTLCVTTDEQTGGVIKMFDITDKSNPIGLGQFTPNSSAIPHNAFIVGDKVHVSWYTEGYRCIDISDPSNPVEVASYDTWPGSSGGFNGCWGCYPFLPSGNILVSDRSTGLYIVRPGGATFETYGQGCVGSAMAPCPELNPNGGTVAGDLRDNEYCYRVPSTGALTVTGFDFWTSSTGGSVTVPAHIYPGSNPGSVALASTTITIGPTSGFYTATFSSPVNVTGDFCIGVDSSAQTVYINSLTSGASGVGFYRDLVNGPNAWTQSGLTDFPSWKVSCTGAGANLTPALGNVGVPTLNTTYNVTLADALPTSFAICVSGLSDTVYSGGALPVALPGAPGCTIFVAPDLLQLFATSATGTASAPFAIPANPANIGVSLYHQWAVVDNVNTLGIVVSNAGKATVDN